MIESDPGKAAMEKVAARLESIAAAIRAGDVVVDEVTITDHGAPFPSYWTGDPELRLTGEHSLSVNYRDVDKGGA